MRAIPLAASIVALLLGGCVEDGAEIPLDVQVGPPASWSQPPAKGVCRLLVSGLMPPDGLRPGGAPYVQGNDCHFEDVLPAGFDAAARILVNVTWDSLQPTLPGRVQATIEHDGCSAANDCHLARAAALRTGPITLQLDAGPLGQHAAQDLVVRVYPEGQSFQQPFSVQLTAQWPTNATAAG